MPTAQRFIHLDVSMTCMALVMALAAGGASAQDLLAPSLALNLSGQLSLGLLPEENLPKLAAAAPTPVRNDTPLASLILDVELRSIWYMTFFPVGSARLGAIGKKSLLKMVPEARKAIEIEITGRTDKTGAVAGNTVLARKRAEAVATALKRLGAGRHATFTLKTDTSGSLDALPLQGQSDFIPTSTVALLRRTDTELRQPVLPR